MDLLGRVLIYIRSSKENYEIELRLETMQQLSALRYSVIALQLETKF